MSPGIPPETRRQLSRLLRVLACGELLAARCASWQSSSAPDARDRRFFGAQARHERFHNRLFEGAAFWLAPRAGRWASAAEILGPYGRRLESAMSAGRWDEVLVGQQTVLEELGRVVLDRLDAEIGHRGLGFEGLRRTVLRQERAHHTYGLRLLDARLASGQASSGRLAAHARDYAELADDVLVLVSPLLDSLDEDADAYRRELRQGLPAWTQGGVP